MSSYKIKHDNTTKSIDVVSVEYHGDWMSSRYINAVVKSADDIDFEVGDYLEYRGERFEIKNAVSVKKQAQKGTYGEAFAYGSVKLESLVDELVATQCLNYTLTNGGEISGNLLSTFSVHCTDVNTFIKLINANLKRAKSQGIITDDWLIIPPTNGLGKTDVTIDVSNINCLEALKMVYDQFGLGYQISKTSRTITIGSVDKINNTFSFGKGNGLRDIERQLDNDYPLITRLRVVGSDKNMPRHYYYLLSAEKMEFQVKVMQTEGQTKYIFVDLPNGITTTETSINGQVKLGGSFFDVTLTYSEEGYFATAANLVFHWQIEVSGDTKTAASIEYAVDYAEAGNTYPMFTFRLPTNKVTSPRKYNVSEGCNPSLLPLNKLIPTKYYAYNKTTEKVEEKATYGSNGSNFVLDPYFDSANIKDYGIREAFVEFNSDDDENGIEEVYPTITNGNNKVTVGSRNTDGSALTDDGIFSTKTDIPGFKITIGNIGFNLKNTRPDGQEKYGTLCMTSGMCGGREFEITGVTYNTTDNTQELTLKRVEDDGTDTWFPNVNFAIAKDDYFVITDIEMPDAMVEAAGADLATKAKAYLAKYDHPHYTYNVTIDNIYMARNHDANGTNSIYWNIKEGDQIQISDTDLIGASATESICIDKLTIKEADGKIPQISITLRNEKKENTLLKISRSVNAANVTAKSAVRASSRNKVTQVVNEVINGEGGSGSGVGNSVSYTAEVTDGNLLGTLNIDGNPNKIYAPDKVSEADHAASADVADALSEEGVDSLRDTFLEKDKDTETTHKITMAEEVVKGDANIQGDLEFGASGTEKAFSQNVKGCKIYWAENGWRIDTDYLSVNKKMYAKEVEVDKVTHVGGEQILTAAGCVAVKVEEKTNYYQVYFEKKDGEGRAVTNDFIAGDLAYCQTFNINEGTSTDFRNKYYWRLVSGVGSTTDYNYIRLSKTIYDNAGAMSMDDNLKGNDVPEVGDNIIQLGFDPSHSVTYNEGDATTIERQGATLISGSGKYRRALVMFEGIKNFSMPTPRIYFSPNKVDMTVDSLKIKVGSTTKELREYMTEEVDGRIIINGDGEDAPTTDDTFIATLLTAVFGANSGKTIKDLEGAVYITTKKMFYMLTWDADAKAYTWTNDTDSTLNDLYEDYGTLGVAVDMISDDYVIANSEKTTIEQTKAEIDAEYDHASEVADGHSNDSIATAFAALTTSYETISGNDGYLTTIINSIPCCFADCENEYDDVTKLSFNRQDFFDALADFRDKMEAFNDAVVSYKVANASEASADQIYNDVKENIESNIAEIVGDTLDARVTNTLIPNWYNNSSGLPAKIATLEAKSDEIDAVVESYDKVSASLNGVIITANNMFAGSSQTNFVQDVDSDGKKLYQPTKQATDESGNALYWVTIDGKKVQTTSATHKDSDNKDVANEKVMIGDYSQDPINETAYNALSAANKKGYTPRMVVSNTDKSGLVTKSGFAAVFAESVDKDGNMSAIAQLGAYVERRYYNVLPADNGVSMVKPTAGHPVYNKQWKKWFYLTPSEDTNPDKGTYYYVKSNIGITADEIFMESGNKTLGNYFSLSNGSLWCQNITVEGVINNLINVIDYDKGVNADKLITVSSETSLDVLRLGDVVRIKSSGESNIYLPYYITKDLSKRTYTMYGGEQHKITIDQLLRLVGRKITIIFDYDEGATKANYMFGGFYYDYVPNTGGGTEGLPYDIRDLANGNLAFIEPTNLTGVSLSGTRIVQMEFRCIQFKKSDGTYHWGYAWFMKSNPDSKSSGIYGDSEWVDADEEDE